MPTKQIKTRKKTENEAKRLIAPPLYRKLRGYAFDPSLSLVIDTIDINNITYKVNWEEDLKKGPIGEYLEVIDYDPTVGYLYEPIDLNDPYLLAMDGLTPSEGNPQFHQQMVYAVAMTTIQNFEIALGRKILWAPRLLKDQRAYEEYVPKLRIYPHALREANAYYSPLKKAILCGYFAASPADRSQLMPGSLVFTCLSHDIIAHEMTHAILDGLHRNYNVPSNPDVLAFHEAFADIVALFQHFTFQDVLKHQIAKTRGNLDHQNLLAELAQQFGSAIGNYGSLRDALGQRDPKTKEWSPKPANTTDYQHTMEPHARGSILVAALFDAFLTIYKNRVRDLIRIATNGTGALPDGDISPDLVNRMSNEAAKSAKHILRMCIRAIDYCPPVDINFGDFLRAIITADVDLVNEDSRDYRLAFIEAFRKRGIYPDNITILSEDSLRIVVDNNSLQPETQERFRHITEKLLRPYMQQVIYETDREKIYNISKNFIAGFYADQSEDETAKTAATPSGEQRVSRYEIGIHHLLGNNFENSFEFEKLSGLVFNEDWKTFGARRNKNNELSYQIINLRLVNRVGPDDQIINHIVFSLIQSIGVVFEKGEFKGVYSPKTGEDAPSGGFEIQGGCTFIFDLNTQKLKHAISKPLLSAHLDAKGNRQLNMERINRQYRYTTEELPLHLSELSLYFENGFHTGINEPFALLHHH